MHISVLLEECIENLNLKSDSIVVDCTLGYAGHSSEILKRITKGYLYAFDQDDIAIKASREKLSKIGDNYEIINKNFVNLYEEIKKREKKVDAILYDLGVSSPQLDEEERGFSYHGSAKLDMRMDKENPVSAYDIVNNYSKEKLAEIFFKYGEAKFSNNIAKKIVEYRKDKTIETTAELTEIIKTAVPMKFRINKHPAKQIFQAIRIEVNHELDVIEPALEQALSILKTGGRVAVITFHSLEDRIVKNFFNEKVKIDPLIKGMPNIPDDKLPDFKLVVNKAIIPTEEEINNNYRAHSAKLRVIERIK